MNFLDLKLKFKNITGDIIAGALLVILAVLLLVWIIPNYVALGFGNTFVTPRSFPKAITIVTLVLGFVVMVRGILNMKKGTEPKQLSYAMSSLVLCVIGILYAIFFEIVGYVPLNVVCLPIIYLLFGGRKWWEAVVITVVFTAICVGFFRFYLQLSIPLAWFM